MSDENARGAAFEKAVAALAREIMLGNVSLDLVRMAGKGGGCHERREEIQT